MNNKLEEYAAEIGVEAPGEILSASNFFYDGGKYYMDSGDNFVPMDQRSVVRHLKATGRFRPDALDLALNEIQRDRYVTYAGPLAGYSRGLHQVSGNLLLATSSPQIVQAREGEWPTLKKLIQTVLGDDRAQITTFFGWLKFSREALLHRRRRPGQALVLAGPRGCGKSLLIDVIEHALGGRRANPYAHFSGRTNFNLDLASAELLVVDDEVGSTDIRARRNFAAAIKNSLFAGAVRIEGKHKNGFMLRPLWRMVIACNDEPESLMVLPPITEDIADKIILFRCVRGEFPWRMHTLDDREAFFATLISELPAMLAEIEGASLPEEYREDRCGVKHFHHPDIVGALRELAPENALLEIVDGLADRGGLVMPWQGTATDLRAVLMTTPSTTRDAEKLLSYHTATGTYLGRLVALGRVEKLTLLNGQQRWRISRS